MYTRRERLYLDALRCTHIRTYIYVYEYCTIVCVTCVNTYSSIESTNIKDDDPDRGVEWA